MNYKLRRFFHKLNIVRYVRNLILCLKYPFIRWYGDPLYRGYPHIKHFSLKYTWLDEIPDGWRKAFGKQLLRDIKKAGNPNIKQGEKWEDLITFEQIKEKWGTLCLYASATDNIQKVLNKYETLSMGYCISCGKPARYVTNGWIEYYCEKCFETHDCWKYENGKRVPLDKESMIKHKKKCRLTKKDLPQYSRFEYKTIGFYDYKSQEECLKNYDLFISQPDRDLDITYHMVNNEDGTWSIEVQKVKKVKINLKKEYGIDLPKLWGL